MNVILMNCCVAYFLALLDRYRHFTFIILHQKSDSFVLLKSKNIVFNISRKNDTKKTKMNTMIHDGKTCSTATLNTVTFVLTMYFHMVELLL